MSRTLASLASLALVVTLASTGALACPCSTPPAEGGGAGCHEPEAGVSAAPMSCGCPCLDSAPAERPATRIGPMLTGSPAATAAPVALLERRGPASVAPDEPATDPPGPSRHLILRI